MKQDNYFTTFYWMRSELKLKGLESDLFAIIYGFSQDEKSFFYGSIDYLSRVSGYSNRAVRTALKKLIEKGFIIKVEGKAGIETNRYSVNFKRVYEIRKTFLQVVKKFNYPPETTSNTSDEETSGVGGEETSVRGEETSGVGGEETSVRGEETSGVWGEETSPDNIDINNIDNRERKRKILFKNSKFINKQSVIQQFLKMKEQDRKQYGGAYIPYYIQVVNEWSEAKDVKRTDRGWFATIKQFIRRDRENDRLMTKAIFEKKFSKKIDRSNSNLF